MTTQPEPFTIPTCGLANTEPLDMDEDTFSEWLECIPEERREEWQTLYNSKAYRFPQPAQPLPGAVLNDWRFYQYTLRINERSEDKRIIEPPYSTWTIDANTKVKGKNKHNLNLFVLTIPAPAETAEAIEC